MARFSFVVEPLGSSSYYREKLQQLQKLPYEKYDAARGETHQYCSICNAARKQAAADLLRMQALSEARG